MINPAANTLSMKNVKAVQKIQLMTATIKSNATHACSLKNCNLISTTLIILLFNMAHCEDAVPLPLRRIVMHALMQRNDALSKFCLNKQLPRDMIYRDISREKYELYKMIMNVSNVAEFRLENSTFVAEAKGRSDDKLKYLAILFGTVTLLTNGILFIMMLLKRPMKKIDKLTADYECMKKITL
ncbi:hypothetical protein T4D_13177 [Trichinella pseudospiralis]|uniref:Uncharacterized protein n=1 Tax=Trichinella pseudospiralis TaxID=6337 RepID=A0A0V1G4W6_TRIPS|nr:hypothetical protein T4D_13177 [Trichinella pseudospiralis]